MTLRVFGSALRSDFGPESDILLEFEAGVDPDLFELGGIQQDLSDLLGREVDLKTPDMFLAFEAPARPRILRGGLCGVSSARLSGVRWAFSFVDQK